MKAAPGNWLMIEGAHLSEPKRHGLILEVQGPDGSPPYLVRWDDSEAETLFVPGPGAHVLTTEQMTQLHSR